MFWNKVIGLWQRLFSGAQYRADESSRADARSDTMNQTRAVSCLPVTPAESLARFIVFSKWIRNNDKTVRPDAFIPYPYPELSVTRHIGLLDTEIWDLGRDVANQRALTLHGRADVTASVVTNLSLRIEPTAEPKNHANVTGWPADKSHQKIIALKMAAQAVFVSRPQRPLAPT
ncbi:MAG: hypothetical protein WCI73_00950 [Phycisphaerae bacterium]